MLLGQTGWGRDITAHYDIHYGFLRTYIFKTAVNPYRTGESIPRLQDQGMFFASVQPAKLPGSIEGIENFGDIPAVKRTALVRAAFNCYKVKIEIPVIPTLALPFDGVVGTGQGVDALRKTGPHIFVGNAG